MSTKDEEDSTITFTSTVRAPSHILNDGRFINLPAPTKLERASFFERSIAHHGLICASSSSKNPDDDGSGDKVKDVPDGGSKAPKKKDSGSSAQKIHPLAIASARIRGCGVAELSKAINLGGLVGGEYFDLSNIVNSASEAAIALAPAPPSNDTSKEAPTAPGTKQESPTASGLKEGVTASSVPKEEKSDILEKTLAVEDRRLRSSFVLKRKFVQFGHGARVLVRHKKRLTGTVMAQQIVDKRLLQLRKKWRLVAPEHGTRSVGPVRPTEVVAIDVEVYDRDRTGGGNNALLSKKKRLGRIARMVPRYATVELKEGCDITLTDTGSGDTEKVTDGKSVEEIWKEKSDVVKTKTCAEPFAVADPTLGKIDADFDPDKVPMLTLLLSIEKTATGYVQSVTLNKTSQNPQNDTNHQIDQSVIGALQHSLFCASLFDSIRREVAQTNTNDNPTNNTTRTNSTNNIASTAWISGEMDQAFLPPPSLLAGGGSTETQGTLCIVHCHEGEVKVRLDSEYAITVQLVEAETDIVTNTGTTTHGTLTHNNTGTQTKEQLEALGRALLLQAQFVFHDYCMRTRTRKIATATRVDNQGPKVAAHFKQPSDSSEGDMSPCILQQCVCLGAKFLFEKKVRACLKRIHKWINTSFQSKPTFAVEWSPLSLFDSYSHFCICVQCTLSIDVTIRGDLGMTVTTTHNNSEGGDYRSVKFGSVEEFELYIRMEIHRLF